MCTYLMRWRISFKGIYLTFVWPCMWSMTKYNRRKKYVSFFLNALKYITQISKNQVQSCLSQYLQKYLNLVFLLNQLQNLRCNLMKQKKKMHGQIKSYKDICWNFMQSAVLAFTDIRLVVRNVPLHHTGQVVNLHVTVDRTYVTMWRDVLKRYLSMVYIIIFH